jgi:DNA-binding cell septation regulator SpoVG
MSLTFTAKVNRISNPRGALRAFATLVINDVVEINGFRILEGSKGTWAAPPQKKGSKPDPETGKDVYYDEVRFNEPKQEGQFRGPVAEQALAAVMAAYNAGSVTTGGTDSRPSPSGERPQAKQARW